MRCWLLLLFLASTAARSAAATPAEPPASATATPAPHSKDAPADEYFGAFGMSPLSIRSTIGFLGRQYHYRTISDRDLLRKALMAEAALRAWRARYPQDSWLAPTFFHLEQLYQAVQTAEARKHATAILKDTIYYFPDTKQGHLSRARLAAGFPPLVAESPLLVTPAPTAAPESPAPGQPTPPLPGGSATPITVETPSPGPAATQKTPLPDASAAPTSARRASPK